MKKIVLFVALLSMLCITGFSGHGDLTSEVIAATTAPTEFAQTGFPQVIVVSGSNYDMGFQYGVQNAAQTYHQVMVIRRDLLKQFTKEQYRKDAKAWAYYTEKHVPSNAEWLRGIAAGLKKAKFKGVDYLDLVITGFATNELWTRPAGQWVKPGASKAQIKRALRGPQIPAGTGGPLREEHHSCVAFGATGNATHDGNAVVSINNELGNTMLDHFILVAFPEKGYNFISFPMPGGTSHNQGMNSAGFAWVMPAAPTVEPIWGVPVEAAFHYLNQHTGSAAEAETWLASIPRGGCNGMFLLSDKTGYLAAVEANAQKFTVRHPGDLGENKDFVSQANHFNLPEMLPYNWVPGPDTSSDSFYRYSTAYQYATEAAVGSMDLDWLKAMYRSDDWYDPVEAIWHYNDPLSWNILDSSATVTQSLWYPASQTAYLMIGAPSGIGQTAYSTGEYVKLVLKDSPLGVVDQADTDAYSLYLAAWDTYKKAKNDGASYLTYEICQSLEDMLDKAILEWSYGTDQASFGYSEEDKSKQSQFLGKALTHYAAAQLYAQMVSTQLKSLALGNLP